MSNRWYNPHHPEYEGGEMEKANEDYKLKGKKSEIKFAPRDTHNPNDKVKKLGQQKGAE